MKTILEFIVVAIVGILPNIYGAVLSIRRPNYTNELSPGELIVRRLLNSLSQISVVLLVALNHPSGLAAVGIYPGYDVSSSNPIVIGMTALLCLYLIIGIAQRVLYRGEKIEIDFTRPDIVQTIHYQNTWERLADLTVLPFEVVGEELVYRGYLVLLLGRVTGTLIPWAILSIGLSILIHLYQGRNRLMVLSHFLTFTLLAGLTIFTGNIGAAIAAHLLNNFLNAFLIWARAGREKDQPMHVMLPRRKFVYLAIIIVNALILACACLSLGLVQR